MKTRMSALYKRTEFYNRGDTQWLGVAVAAAFVTMPLALVLSVVPVPALLA